MPYKGYNVEKDEEIAIEELEKNAGTQFYSELASVFINKRNTNTRGM